MKFLSMACLRLFLFPILLIAVDLIQTVAVAHPQKVGKSAKISAPHREESPYFKMTVPPGTRLRKTKDYDGELRYVVEAPGKILVNVRVGDTLVLPLGDRSHTKDQITEVKLNGRVIGKYRVIQTRREWPKYIYAETRAGLPPVERDKAAEIIFSITAR